MQCSPALNPLFIAYNTAGAGGRLLHTICIVRKYFHFGPMVAALHSVFPRRDLDHF